MSSSVHPLPGAARAWLELTAVAASLAVLGGLVAATPEPAASLPSAAGVPQQVSPTPSATYSPWTPAGTWTVLHSPDHDPLWRGDPPTLRGISLQRQPDGKYRGYAVGEGGALARFDGNKWTALSDFDPRSTAPKTYNFHDVFVKAMDDVWVVGEVLGDTFCDGCGTVLHYNGTAWQELDRYEGYHVNGRMGALNAIDMLQDANGDWYGWAVGDDADFDRFKAIILQYTPDGKWRIWTSHNIAKNLNDVHLVSPTEAWAVGQDGVESRYNEDSGTGIWPPLGRSGSDTLYAVDLTDPLSGWDGGFRGRMNKYRGHCHDDDPSTTCWFQNEAMPIETDNGSQWAITVYAIDLLDRDRGWLVGAASGRISNVAWSSSSKSWSLFPVVDDPGVDLRGLQMLGPGLGYAVGADGVILQYKDTVAPTATPTASRTATPTATPSATGQAATASATGPSDTPEVTQTPTEEETGWPTSTDEPTATETATESATESPRPTEWTLYAPFVTRRR